MQPYPILTPVNNVAEEYQQHEAQYPAYSDYSFATLNIWWSVGQNAAVAKLGDNLVLQLFSGEAHPTYTFIGTDNVTKYVKQLLESMHKNSIDPKLVHVPYYVVEHLDKDIFSITEELDYNEYLLSAEELTKLEGSNHSRTRRKVARFLREAGDGPVTTEVIDFDNKEEVANVLRFCEERVINNPRGNDLKGDEINALRVSIQDAVRLGMKGLIIRVDGQVHAVVLYQVTHDDSSYIVNHIKSLDEIPHTFDYATNAVAKMAFNSGIPYINFEMDLGIEGLRHHKMGLRPVSFLRKYTVTLSD